jgi:hypothetical protein
MTPNTLIERLRGLIRVPVNDGAGLLNDKDFFERQFPASKIALEAADRIEALEAALHNAFMAMCDQRDHPDNEVFQDAIDALGMAASRANQQLRKP